MTTLHLRARKGGPLCGDRGETVATGVLEWYLRQRSRRCERCIRVALEYLAAIPPVLLAPSPRR